MKKMTSFICALVVLCLLTGCNHETGETIYPTTNTQINETVEKAPTTIIPTAQKDDGRYEYLQGYSILKLGNVEIIPSDVEAEPCYPELPKMEEVNMSWDDISAYYGDDLTPAYLPEGLCTPAETGRPQTWNFYRITEPYDGREVGDYYCDTVEMMYFEEYPEWYTHIDPDYGSHVYVYQTRTTPLPFSPVNRGVYIKAESSDLALSDHWEYTEWVENDRLSYYKDTPIYFWQQTDEPYAELCTGEKLYENINEPIMGADAQNTEEYQSLFNKFLDGYPRELRNQKWTAEDLAAWNGCLTENGMEPELFKPYHAKFYYNGIRYTATSNLEFETFAAVIASLIHD